MVFNSITFLIFIGVFFPLYFSLKGRARLWLCFLASYLFYGWWDWRFLALIATSTVLDFWIGQTLEQTAESTQRKRLLWLSVAVNLGCLAFFKYFNFFLDSFQILLTNIGYSGELGSLQIILPVGISFYTFQSMSYTIDIYYGKIKHEKDWLRFATFIAFFPQLVAGPIVRAKEFLPQFERERKLDHERIIIGLGQVIWGFFKKIAVADSLAPFVDQCFASPSSFGSLHLLIGVIFYSFQIYCDFSGYSDIAIGLARMMGFDFPKNFRTPYFSKDFSEFWTRWHITLSSWLRDYLYIPLGGNRHGTFNTYKNLMITMLLGGLWHGASWVFVFWGFLHGMYLVIQRLFGAYWGQFLEWIRTPKVVRQLINMSLVYTFTCLAWIFFRATDFENALQLISGLGNLESFNLSQVTNKFWVIKGFLLIGVLLLIEVSDFKFDYRSLMVKSVVFRVTSMSILIWLMAFMGTFDSNAFIYFQF
ncbi:MAG: MBOAT family protein [Saprospiraceae bacterium]|nr:MBOAT family protein [Saprospiraceae bacterium]